MVHLKCKTKRELACRFSAVLSVNPSGRVCVKSLLEVCKQVFLDDLNVTKEMYLQYKFD